MSESNGQTKEREETTSSSLKDQGNAFFKSGNYLKAAAIYTQAIKNDPQNHALYSNRSAAFLHLSKVTKALADAETTIKLQPSFEKGHFRKGCALEALKKYDEALAAFKEAAELNPQSKDVQNKMRHLQRVVRDSKRLQGAAHADSSSSAAASAGGSSSGAAPPGSNSDKGAAQEVDKRVSKFRDAMERTARSMWAQREPQEEAGAAALAPLEASVHFLAQQPGDNKKDQMQVNIREAFDSPDTLQNCISFLRQQAIEFDAIAACLIVQRSAIAFPQVWRGLGERQWPCGSQDGYFVQVETCTFRTVTFTPAQAAAAGHLSSMGNSEDLDPNTYCLLPPLLR
eukprot:jgi/Mesen1/8549/ME000484S07937